MSQVEWRGRRSRELLVLLLTAVALMSCVGSATAQEDVLRDAGICGRDNPMPECDIDDPVSGGAQGVVDAVDRTVVSTAALAQTTIDWAAALPGNAGPLVDAGAATAAETTATADALARQYAEGVGSVVDCAPTDAGCDPIEDALRDSDICGRDRPMPECDGYNPLQEGLEPVPGMVNDAVVSTAALAQSTIDWVGALPGNAGPIAEAAATTAAETVATANALVREYEDEAAYTLDCASRPMDSSCDPVREAFYENSMCGRDNPDPECKKYDGIQDTKQAVLDGSCVVPGTPACDPDADGVPNSTDECPTQKGSPPSGCVDTDGDTVPDHRDDCPSTRGSATYGCPDTDGDGWEDRHDPCPGQFGTVKGCPDLDGDGVNDKEDPCPEEPGQIGGCPDTYDPSPAQDVPEPEGTVNWGDGDQWQEGNYGETHDATEQAGGGGSNRSAAAAGLSCDADDPVFGETYFDIQPGRAVPAAAGAAVDTAQDALMEALSLPMMPPLSVVRFQETRRSSGFRRYSLIVDGRAVAVIEVVSAPASGWQPYRFAACSKVINRGRAAR